jgi:hypothetical protein
MDRGAGSPALQSARIPAPASAAMWSISPTPSEVAGVRDGHYAGTTEEGDEAVFIVRSPVPDPEPDR